MSNDFELAKKLQKQLNEEQAHVENDYLNSTQNLVHPDWESLDPTPDVHRLFTVFGRKFFQDRLTCVTLEWSKRMYQCAGICYQRRSRVGMSCTIRLSEPLLKLRSRKDLVETLLHEMIHAYCFVLGIREGNGGHGPQFVKIMTGINKVAGTNISVYHSFHDEVNLYKTHWWRCDGVCQDRKPFYGFVKRTSNRAPGPNDFWFAQHQATCGGNFIKVKEPEPKKKKTGKENKAKAVISSSPNRDIRTYFGKPTSVSQPAKALNGLPKFGGGATKPNFGGSTVVVRKPPSYTTNKTSSMTNSQPNSSRINTIHGATSSVGPKKPVSPGGNLRNVRQFKDLNDSCASANGNGKTGHELPKTGGQILGGSSRPKSRLLDEYSPKPAKKMRLNDSDVIMVEQPVEVINLAEDDEDSHATEKEAFIRSLFNGDDFEDIELIDSEFDGNYLNDGNDDLIQAAVDPTHLDSSLIDDIFDTDTLMDKFNTDEKTVECPLCAQRVARLQMSEHLQTCSSLDVGDTPVETGIETPQPSTSTGITDKNRWDRLAASTTEKKNPETVVEVKTCATTLERQQEIEMLRSCGYSEEDIVKVFAEPLETQSQQDQKELDAAAATIILDDDESDTPRVDFLDELKPCPVCNKSIRVKDLNDHLDTCLQASADLFD